MTPPLGSDTHETKKSQSNKIVPSDDGESEKSEEEYQAVISPSSPQGLLKMRSALDDLTNASQSPSDQPKKEANKEVVKDISKKINRNTPALELAKNNEINKKYELEPSSAAVTTMILNSVEKPLTVNISTISKAPTTEEASLLKKPLVLKEKPTTRDTIYMKRSLSLKKDINWNKTSGFVEPLSLLEETESDLEFVSEPVTFGNKYETEEATFPKSTLPSTKLYISQGKQFCCVKELISLDNNIENDSFMETMNFRKKPKTEESTTTERLLTLNKRTTQEKVSYKRKPLILQKATSREKLLNEEPFSFENKSTTKELCCVKELTSLDNNIEKDSFMEPMNFRKKPKMEESTTTERLLTLNKRTTQEKVSYKRKPLILQKATSREKLLNEEPFSFENKSTTKQLCCVKELTSLDNNIENDSFMEPMNFRKKPKMEESTTTERLLTLNKRTTQEKVSYKRKPLILQKATSREKLLNEEPFSFENKSTTKELCCVKELTSLDNNIEKDSFMEPMKFRKKPKTEESTTTERLLTLNKCTTQEKMSYKRKPLILQKATSREKLLNEEPFSFENKSTTKEFLFQEPFQEKHTTEGDISVIKKPLTLQKNPTEEESLLKEPLVFKKKHTIEEATPKEVLVFVKRRTTKDRLSCLKKPLVLQTISEEKSLFKEPLSFKKKPTTEEEFLFKESSVLPEKHTTQGEVALLKKPWALQENIHSKDEFLMEPVYFRKKHTTNEAISSKEPLSLKKKKHTTQIMTSICQEVLDLQNVIGKDKDSFVMKPGPFRKKSSTEETIDTKTLLSLKKKHIIDTKEDSLKKLLTLQEKSTTEEDSLYKKPSILKKKLSTEAIISTDSQLSLKKKSTAQGEVFLLKKQLSLQQKPSIEKESPITEELTFQRKLAINDSFNLKTVSLNEKSTTGKKVSFKEPLVLQDNPTQKEDTSLKDVSILPVNISSHVFNSPPESRTAKSLSDILSIVSKYRTSRKHSARKPKKRVSDWRRISKKEITILEIIDQTHYDPFFNLSYTQDIFKYMKEREEKFRLKNYMSSQTDINSDTRALLVNWLVKIQINCDLIHESLYLAVKLVDRYLMKKICKKENMQLLGATASLIAAKLEETYQPKLEKFLKSRKEAYQRHEMLAMEMNILRTLEYEVNIPVAYHFLRMYSMNIHVDIKTVVLSRFICELTLHEYDFIQEKGSELAAASFLLALYMTKLKSVAHLLDYHFGYKPSDLSRLVTKLNKLLTLYPYNDRFKAVSFKYSHKNFYEVTKIPLLDKLKLEEILSSR